MNVSLLISTYNWKKALELSLLSVFEQTILPKEILIADDGSTDDTRKLIDEMREISPIPIIHVWHEDKGFRVAIIRNKALARATGDYIVQIDGDIFLNRHFIQDHIEMAQKGYFVCGSRVSLSAKETEGLLNSQIKRSDLSSKIVFNNMRSKILRHLLAERYAKNSYKNIRGSNIAFWYKDLIAINGYDETFDSWGPEDRELVSRLFNLGVKKKSLKIGGVCFHLHHGKLSRSEVARLSKIFMNSIEKDVVRTEVGLDRHIEELRVNTSTGSVTGGEG